MKYTFRIQFMHIKGIHTMTDTHAEDTDAIDHAQALFEANPIIRNIEIVRDDLVLAGFGQVIYV